MYVILECMKNQIYIMNINKLNDDVIFEKYIKNMPMERQEKIKRFKYRMDKNRSLGAGILLARGLLDNGIRTEEAWLKESEEGKPYLAGVRRNGTIESCEFHFSLSHAGDYVAAAFAEVPVGIDIECEREYSQRLMRRCLGEEEQMAIRGCANEEERRNLFLRYWTIKESAVKVSGYGMQIPFSGIRIDEERRIEVKWKDNLWKYFLSEIEIPAGSDILGMNETKDMGAVTDRYRIAVCAEETKSGEKPVWEETRYEEI